MAGSIRAGVVALVLFAAGDEAFGDSASFRDLGPGRAYAVSEDGSVVLGIGAGGVVLWHADGTHEVLGSLGEPTDLSTDGSVVVGASTEGSGSWLRYEAWRWTRQGGRQSLGALPYPFHWSFAGSVSDDGQVIAGRLVAPNAAPAPFVWTSQSGVTTLPVQAGAAYGISGDGRIVVGGHGLAFRFDLQTQAVAFLQSVPLSWSEALEASRDGSVSVGWIRTDMLSGLGGDTQAMRWTFAGELDGLGFLDDSWEARHSEAEAVSADGSIVVGWALTGTDDRPEPFVWDRVHGMRSLREELKGRFGLAVPWPLDWPSDVSADGRTIVGWSETPSRAWVAVLPPACDDGIDDDGDGLVDLADDGCSEADDLSETFASSACDDGTDGDGDGAVDFPADPGCSAAGDASETAFHLHCDDGQDNDRDGLADADDPGCDGPSDPSERSSASACDDGIDNDGDGMVDVHPEGDRVGMGYGDPSCFDPAWNSETSKCQDGIDNDGDGGIDTYGGPNEEPPDSVCAGAPWRNREAPSACGLGFELVGLASLAMARRWRSRSIRTRVGTSARLLCSGPVC